MALVIEHGVIGGKRIKRVAFLTGMGELEAFARLAMLWEESQKLSRDSGCAEELGFWLGATTKEQGDSWVQAYSDSLAGFLERQEDGSFKIRGNKKHIEKSKAVQDANRERALRRWKKQSGNAAGMPEDPGQDGEMNAGGMPPVYQPDTGRNAGGIPDGCRLDAQAKRTKPSQAYQADIYIPHPDEIDACVRQWGKTLARYEIEKDPRLDRVEIVRLLQHRGYEKTILALLGAGFEESSDRYKPKRHCRITRLLKPDIFELHVNLGAQNQPKKRQVYNPDTGKYETEEVGA